MIFPGEGNGKTQNSEKIESGNIPKCIFLWMPWVFGFFFNFYFLNFFSSFKLSVMCVYSNTEITPNKLQKREIGKEEGRKSREVGGRRTG